MGPIANERTKLTANRLNAMASDMVVTGGVAPLVALALNVADTSVLPAIFASVTVWIGAAAVLHFFARRLLGKLIP